ncbi:MAG: zf-HC2 domain-containing protein [Acidobacteria bacterium]|nr:zf-HC2 domain-containing protein [Acidobacteriota bacterium]
MQEDNFKPLLMGYLDSELTELESIRVEQHLEQCAECARELEEFRRLKEVTRNMRVATPDARSWDEYWSHVYNRLERRVGWVLVSIGAILILSYGVYSLIAKFLLRSDFPLIVRFGAVAIVVGFCTLLISVLRERLFMSRIDKYERIKR